MSNGDPRVGGRRLQRTVRHREQVHAARLGHVPLRVEHDHLVDPGGDPFHLGEDVREIVKRLDARAQALAVVDRRRGRERHETLVVAVLGPQLDRVDDADDGRLGALAGVEPQVAHPARDQEADVGVVEPALRDRLFHQPVQRRLRHRNLDPHALGRGVQAAEVLGETEHAAVVHPDALEHAVAVQQAVVEHRDFGARAVVVRPVDPDDGWHSPLSVSTRRSCPGRCARSPYPRSRRFSSPRRGRGWSFPRT